MSLPEILGTSNGIDALCDFLLQSGAFSRTSSLLKLQPLFENEHVPPMTWHGPHFMSLSALSLYFPFLFLAFVLFFPLQALIIVKNVPMY